ncbi:SRF-type transcription factor RlmA [Pseudohyphozyma bogoriensis]|nr:SRF-type transcription factor RlmA [Pseudohyphozyma bogoriensis]
MGRRKISIAPISDDRNRSVTFLKRKNGLFKKAFELGVLCSAEVAVVVFNSNGKLFEFSSGDMDETLLRYSNFNGQHERRGPADYANPDITDIAKRGLGGKMTALSDAEDDDLDGDAGAAGEEEDEVDSDSERGGGGASGSKKRKLSNGKGKKGERDDSEEGVVAAGILQSSPPIPLPHPSGSLPTLPPIQPHPPQQYSAPGFSPYPGYAGYNTPQQAQWATYGRPPAQGPGNPWGAYPGAPPGMGMMGMPPGMGMGMMGGMPGMGGMQGFSPHFPGGPPPELSALHALYSHHAGAGLVGAGALPEGYSQSNAATPGGAAGFSYPNLSGRSDVASPNLSGRAASSQGEVGGAAGQKSPEEGNGAGEQQEKPKLSVSIPGEDDGRRRDGIAAILEGARGVEGVDGEGGEGENGGNEGGGRSNHDQLLPSPSNFLNNVMFSSENASFSAIGGEDGGMFNWPKSGNASSGKEED